MAKPNADRERVNLWMDASLIKGMKQLADLSNTTYSELVRQACQEYILKHGRAALAAAQKLKEMVDG